MLQFVVPDNIIVSILIKFIKLEKEFQMRKIAAQTILYIERIDKDYRKIVFSTPYVLDKVEHFEAIWKTRSSLKSIISKLNFNPQSGKYYPFFTKISSKIIARTIFISGRDSRWEHIQLTGVNYLDQSYKVIELPIGRDYLPQIQSVFKQFFTLKASNSYNGDCPDIIMINPIDIIMIKSTKRSKTLYLSKPFIKYNKPCFEVNWKTTLSTNEILTRFDFIIQINKNTLVSLYHIKNHKSFIKSMSIELILRDKSILPLPLSVRYKQKI